MSEPQAKLTPLPSALAKQTRFVRLAGAIPALFSHPDWTTPAPTLIWLHGRTVNKELDNGRYLRLLRAGIACCAIDLPGHGERFDAYFQRPEHTLEMLELAVAEVDRVVDALADPALGGCFDLDRLALGGMSAGGMITLRRLCDGDHAFKAAAVESAAGNLRLLYAPGPAAAELAGFARSPRAGLYDAARVARLDPMARVADFRPLPLLALHSEADRVVPLPCVTTFVETLRGRYESAGLPREWIELKTWPETGAPDEHSGFGRVAAEAKTVFVDFLCRRLGVTPTS